MGIRSAFEIPQTLVRIRQRWGGGAGDAIGGEGPI